jgi:hypothetical protein
MVVRLPEFAERVGSHKTPTAYGRIYRGIDRLPWEIESEQYRTLEFRRFFKNLGCTFFAQRNIRITQDRDDVMKFLELTSGRLNEIIAVYTNDILDSPTLDVGSDLELLGIELFALGEWSPHSAVFFHAERYKHWIMKFNEHGLFNDFSLCESFGREYVAESRVGRLEPLADPPIFINLAIYRVNSLL